jgi:hypothetical protein
MTVASSITITLLWAIAGRSSITVGMPASTRKVAPEYLERMVYELRGLPCLSLEEVMPDRKSLMASRSFGRTVETRRELEEAIAVYTSRAAEKMRRQQLATATVTVFVETNRFMPSHPQYEGSRTVRLPVASADAGKLMKAAITAVAVLYRPGYRYKKSRCHPARPGAGGDGAAWAIRRVATMRSHSRAFGRLMSQWPLRPRHHRLWHGRRASGMGAAAGIHIATLFDRLGRAVAGVSRASSSRYDVAGLRSRLSCR